MNVAPGGWKYAIPPLLVAPFALVYSVGAALAAIAIGVGTLAFFRDPERTPPARGLVAPCDGTVSVLRNEDGRIRLGIFMNVWHVHVVRSPFEATVTDVEHVSGANRPAFSKESDRNERVHVRVQPDGRLDSEESAADDTEETDATITLIAGAFARRIHPYIEAGDTLDRGERIGHIAFGSRVDVLFPPSVEADDIAVEVGESMTAGETVIVESAAEPIDEIEFGFELDDGTEGGEPA